MAGAGLLFQNVPKPDAGSTEGRSETLWTRGALRGQNSRSGSRSLQVDVEAALRHWQRWDQSTAVAHRSDGRV